MELGFLGIVKEYLSDFPHRSFEQEGAPSLLFYNTKPDDNRFGVILNAHIDVVPAEAAQYQPFEQDGRLYGRGAADMKTGAAVLIVLFRELAARLPYPLALQIVSDEEPGGFHGTKYQLEQGVRGDFVIAAETTDMRIVTQAKGVLGLRLKVPGKSAHSAYLWQGDNAVVTAADIIGEINQAYPIPTAEAWETTVNVAAIKTTNTTANKVPGDCELYLDIRYIPGEHEQVLTTIERIIAGKATHTIVEDEPSQCADETNPDFAALAASIQQVLGRPATSVKKPGASDMRHYNAFGSRAAVVFGPSGDNLHGDDEYLELDSIAPYYKILETFLLGRSDAAR